MTFLNIIIAGAGKVGWTLAEHLAEEGHSVTVVDVHEDTLNKVSNQLDVLCIQGNCASQATLREADANDADILIATTNSDEINMLCCHNAHQLGIPYTVARVRNNEYFADGEQLKNDLGINMIINPEFATAEEISRLLRFPSASNVETFARGRVEIISFIIQEKDGLAGHAISSLAKRIKELPVLFCAVERDGNLYIPNGNFTLNLDDKVYVTGTPSGIHQLFRLLGRDTHKIRSVFIIGGGQIAFYLLLILERLNLSCKLVERNPARCRVLAEKFPHSLIIFGDGTDPELLTEERMSANDAFVALTDRDEDNLIISLFAYQNGVQKVIAKSNHQNYSSISRSAGLESIVSPKYTTVAQILQTVRGIQNSKGNVMTALYKIADGNAEAMEFVVSASTRNLDVPLKSMKLKNGILIAAIVRNNKIIIPDGSTCLKERDTVIVIAKDSGITDLNSIYADTFGLGG